MKKLDYAKEFSITDLIRDKILEPEHRYVLSNFIQQFNVKTIRYENRGNNSLNNIYSTKSLKHLYFKEYLNRKKSKLNSVKNKVLEKLTKELK